MNMLELQHFATTKFLVLLVCLVSGCGALQHRGYRFYKDVKPGAGNYFQFSVGYDTLKELGGLGSNEASVISSLLERELRSHRYCPNGYVIDKRTWSQGGSYLTYHGHCS